MWQKHVDCFLISMSLILSQPASRILVSWYLPKQERYKSCLQTWYEDHTIDNHGGSKVILITVCTLLQTVDSLSADYTYND